VFKPKNKTLNILKHMKENYYLGFTLKNEKISSIRVYDKNKGDIFFLDNPNEFSMKGNLLFFKLNLDFFVPINKVLFFKVLNLKRKDYRKIDLKTFLIYNGLEEWCL
jgi:hypothetical protein